MSNTDQANTETESEYVPLTEEQIEGLKPFQEAYKATHGKDTVLSPEMLYDLVTNEDNQEEYGDDNMDAWVEAMIEAEGDSADEESGPAADLSSPDVQAEVAASDASQSWAWELAEKSSADEQFTKDLNNVTESSAFLKIAPVLLMQDLERIHGKDGLMVFPEPDSADPDKTKARAKVGNVMFDRYKTYSKTSGKRTGVSWYRYFYEGTTEGKKTLQRFTAIKENPDKNFPDYTDDRIESEIATLNQRLNDGAKAVRQAVKLFRQIERLKQYPTIDIGWVTEVNKDGTPGPIARTRNPIFIKPKGSDRGNAYSVGQTLSFDIDKAMEGGGTWQSLKGSIKRTSKAAAQGGTENKEGDKTPVVTNAKQFDAALGAMAHFFLDLYEPDSKQVKDFYRELRASDHMQESIKELIKFAKHVEPTLEAIDRDKARKTAVANGERKAS